MFQFPLKVKNLQSSSFDHRVTHFKVHKQFRSVLTVGILTVWRAKPGESSLGDSSHRSTADLEVDRHMSAAPSFCHSSSRCEQVAEAKNWRSVHKWMQRVAFHVGSKSYQVLRRHRPGHDDDNLIYVSHFWLNTSAEIKLITKTCVPNRCKSCKPEVRSKQIFVGILQGCKCDASTRTSAKGEKKEKAPKLLRFRPPALAVSKSTLSPGNLFSYPRFKDGRKGVYFSYNWFHTRALNRAKKVSGQVKFSFTLKI